MAMTAAALVRTWCRITSSACSPSPASRAFATAMDEVLVGGSA